MDFVCNVKFSRVERGWEKRKEMEGGLYLNLGI